MPKKGLAKLVERLRAIEWSRARLIKIAKGAGAVVAAGGLIYGASTFYFADQEQKATTRAAKLREIEAREQAEKPVVVAAKPVPRTILDQLLTQAATDPVFSSERSQARLLAKREQLVAINADLDAWVTDAKKLEKDRAAIDVALLLDGPRLATPDGIDRARTVLLAFDGWRERAVGSNIQLLQATRAVDTDVLNGAWSLRDPTISTAVRRTPDLVSALTSARQAEIGAMRTIAGIVSANLPSLRVDREAITMTVVTEDKRYQRAVQSLREHLDDERSMQNDLDALVFEAFYDKMTRR